MNRTPSISNSISVTPDRIQDYWELTKPRLVFLVLLSTLVGFILGSGHSLKISLLLSSLFGTSLVAAGSMALNEWMERDLDARMPRTARRPLPLGKLEPRAALAFGIFLSAAGLFVLEMAVNRTSSILAGLTLVSYLLLYTPLKRKTELCTIVGALPGALPPLIGWSASGAPLSLEAWILFSILFLWQMPHFLAIGWMYREQYANAGFRMLSLNDSDGHRVGRQIILYSLALLPVSLLPTLVGLTGLVYFFGAFVLGIGLIVFGLISLKHMDQKARWLFRASVIYLTCLLILMVADKT